MNNTKSQKKELKMTKELYQRHFPQNKKVDYRKLQMSNVSLYSMDEPIFISNVVDLIKSYFHGFIGSFLKRKAHFYLAICFGGEDCGETKLIGREDWGKKSD